MSVLKALRFAVAAFAAGAVTAAPVESRAAGSADACACTGAVIGNVCYDSLSAAISAAPSGSTISIGGKKVVPSTIEFNKSINLMGVNCGSAAKATLSAKMSSTEGGMLEVRGPGTVRVGLQNIVFTREPGCGPVAALRGGVLIKEDSEPSDYTDVEAPVVDLDVSNCEFVGLSTKAMGGSAIYIMRPGKVNIDSRTSFCNNIVEKNGERYGGGGTMWLVEVGQSSSVNIDGVWRDNVGKFEHSLGGAIMINTIRGNVRIRGEYRGNKASDGGAVHVERVEATGLLDIKALFDSNEAVEYGWGSRAGAVRVQYVLGKVTQDGTYTNNKSGGRGGVSATNRMYAGGVYIFKGTYTNNYAKATGGVFDMLDAYDFERTAKLTLDGSCKFQGNVAQGGAGTNVLSIGPLGKVLSESQWQGQPIIYSR